MRTTTYVTRLSHGPGVVSAFLADLRNDAKWREEVVGAEVVSGTPGSSGASYREKVNWEGVQTVVNLTTREVAPDSRLIVVAADPGYESSYEYQFAPLDGGTELTLFMSIRTNGPLKVVEPLIWALITRWVERDLDLLDSAIGQPSYASAGEVAEPAAVFDSAGETSRAFVGEVIDHLAEGIVLYSAMGRVFYANAAVGEMLQIPREAVLGRRYDDPAFLLKTREGLTLPPGESPFERVRATGQPLLSAEYLAQPANGQSIIVSINAVPLAVHDTFAGVAVSATDITRRVRIEAELRDSEQRFRSIVDQSMYGIVISSPDGEVALYNSAMERITGHSFREVKELGWLRAAFPDEEERRLVAEQAQKSLRGELPYLEAPYTREDGRVIWVSYAASPVRLHGKDYLFSIVSDVTERREAEARVRFQSRLLNEVRNAVVATDVSGALTYANDEAVQLLGRQGEELLGRGIMEVVRPAAVSSDTSVMQKVMSAGKWEGEATFTRADGSTVPVLLTLAKLADEHGKPEGFVGVAIDITQIKAAESALQEKDRAIRQAYVDVLSAVTGGKLVLLTAEEMADALGRPISDEKPLLPDTLVESRGVVCEYLSSAGTKEDPETGVVAYSEAATNALRHAGKGRYRLFRKNGAVQVSVFDSGPGIDFGMLPKATLVPGFSSTETLGMGFTIMLNLADRVLLATAPGYTQVTLEFGVAPQTAGVATKG